MDTVTLLPATTLPEPKPVSQTAPEHVDNIATGLAGAALSAPLAAVEALSPALSQHLSNAGSTLSNQAAALSATLQGHAKAFGETDTAASMGEKLGQAKESVLNALPTSLSGRGVLPPTVGGTSVPGDIAVPDAGEVSQLDTATAMTTDPVSSPAVKKEAAEVPASHYIHPSSTVTNNALAHRGAAEAPEPDAPVASALPATVFEGGEGLTSDPMTASGVLPTEPTLLPSEPTLNPFPDSSSGSLHHITSEDIKFSSSGSVPETPGSPSESKKKTSKIGTLFGRKHKSSGNQETDDL